MTISVLLAEDHTVLREGLRMLLEDKGDLKVVGQASNGLEAVREAIRLRPQVVLMDIGMPDLNGVEATLQIRKACPDTHVVVLSVHNTAEHIHRALEAGAVGYLLKQSASEEVVVAIRSAASGRHYLDPNIHNTVVHDYLRRRGSVPGKSPLDSLSERERRVLQLVAEGKTSKEIADMEYISVKTVDTYRSRLMRKLGIHDTVALIRFAIEHGLTPEGQLPPE